MCWRSRRRIKLWKEGWLRADESDWEGGDGDGSSSALGSSDSAAALEGSCMPNLCAMWNVQRSGASGSRLRFGESDLKGEPRDALRGGVVALSIKRPISMLSPWCATDIIWRRI